MGEIKKESEEAKRESHGGWPFKFSLNALYLSNELRVSIAKQEYNARCIDECIFLTDFPL